MAHPGASARAGALAAQLRPTGEGDGAGARGRPLHGPHTSERVEGGGTALAIDGGVNRRSAGETRPPVGSAAIRRR